MTLAEIQSEIAEYRELLKRIPFDDNPDNDIARQIYQRLIDERLVLLQALTQKAQGHKGT